jgi:hypothetical protein
MYFFGVSKAIRNESGIFKRFRNCVLPILSYQLQKQAVALYHRLPNQTSIF